MKQAKSKATTPPVDNEQMTGKDSASSPPPSYGIGFVDSSQSGSSVASPKEDRTGLPPQLKSGLETLSGLDLSTVRVHYNSSKPAQLDALAYAQGREIHIGPGQETHLPHEGWHAVQQMQGRVKATTQLRGLVDVNDDPALEKEADEMGLRALRLGGADSPMAKRSTSIADTGPVQARIAIPPNVDNALAGFKANLHGANASPANMQIKVAVVATTMYDPFLTPLLQGAFTYRFADADAFLGWLQANHAGGPAAVAPLTAAQVGVQHAGHGSITFVNDVPNVAVALANPNFRLVLCPNDAQELTNYFSGQYAALPGQITVCADDQLHVSVAWLAARNQIPAIRLNQIAGFCAPPGRVIVQGPQQRGDMHDIKIALALAPTLRVLYVLSDHRRRAESADILGYYRNHPRVAICGAAFLAAQNLVPNNRRQGVGHATETLVRAARQNFGPTQDTIVSETTGLPVNYPPAAAGPNPVLAKRALYDQDLANVGHFNAGTPYVIVNYRDSGHNVTPPRLPSHPELDTGTFGFQDLVAGVQAAGFTAVPMGEPPGHAGMLAGPNLIRYWGWGSCVAAGAQTKRQAEYGLLRRLNEQYNVKALAMRSGSTDALVFAGIETISLDFATETFAPNQLAGTQLNPSDGSARSWRRAAKRELIRPGKFHQGFLVEPRPDIVAPAPGANWTGAIDPAIHPPAVVPPAAPSSNAQRVTALLQQYFAAPARTFALDPESPLADIQRHAANVRASVQAQKILEYTGPPAIAPNPHLWCQQQSNNLIPPGTQSAVQCANRAVTVLGRANALVLAVGAQLAANPGNQMLLDVQQRANGYVVNLTNADNYLRALFNGLGAAMAPGLAANAYYSRVADIDGATQAVRFAQFAVAQIAARVAADNQIRTGNIQL